MTPDEWAQTISADVWDRLGRGELPAEPHEMKRRYAEVIQKAVLEERERCAKRAESPLCACKSEDIHDGCCAACGTRIASAIRNLRKEE